MFHRYRLRAEYPTLTSFGDVLAEKGYIYEDSIFSRWQNGSRVPSDRGVMLGLIAIFVERGVVKGVEQADELMQSVGMERLSGVERERYGLREWSYLFQVPREVSDFTGREELIKKVVGIKGIEGKVVLLHGPAGVGKTALAIKLAHKLKHKYPDGVLWYKVESGNTKDIIIAIIRALGEELKNIDDSTVLATVARALLSGKQLLLILDSAELSDTIHQIIPKSAKCTVLITTQKTTLPSPIAHILLTVPSFTDQEALELFEKILGERIAKSLKKIF